VKTVRLRAGAVPSPRTRARDSRRGAPRRSQLRELRSGYRLDQQQVWGPGGVPAGDRAALPGDNTEMLVELIQPIAVDEGLRFAIREGGRTVGAGRVTK